MGRCFWVGEWTTGDFVACSILGFPRALASPPPAVILLFLSPLPPVFRALGSPDRRGMQERRRRRKACGKVLTFHRPFPPSLRHTSLLPFFSSNKWGIYIFGWRAPPPPPPEFGGEAWMSAKKLHPSSHSCIYPVHVGEILAAPLSLTPSDPAWLAWGGHALVAHSPIPSPPIQQGCCPPRRRDRRESSSSSPSFTSFS